MTTSGRLEDMMSVKTGWHFVLTFFFLSPAGSSLFFLPGFFIAAGPDPRTILPARLDEITRKHHCTSCIVDD
jgi:hypothetical protein